MLELFERFEFAGPIEEMVKLEAINWALISAKDHSGDIYEFTPKPSDNPNGMILEATILQEVEFYE